MNGVTFGEYHSYNELSLILTNKTIGKAEPKTSEVNIEGMDGVLDLTEYFGDVKYKNRKLTFEFSTIIPMNEFLNLYSNIQNKLNGKYLKIILDEDPDFYYIGRIKVNDWKSNKRIGKITIEADCEPYKYRLRETVLNYVLTGKNDLYLDNLKRLVVPIITTDSEIQITFEERSYSLSAGTWEIDDIILKPGINKITVTGTGNITFEYKEGGL